MPPTRPPSRPGCAASSPRPPDDLILLTGEGLSRLLGVAQRAGIEAEFRAALAGVRRIVRGPKPQARLRSIGLSADISAGEPTTAGVIATLSGAGPQGTPGRGAALPRQPERRAAGLPARRRRHPGRHPALCLCDAGGRCPGRGDAGGDGGAGGSTWRSSPRPRRSSGWPSWRGRSGCGRRSAARGSPRSGRWSARRWRPPAASVSVMPEDSFHMKPMVNAILAAMGAAGQPA